MKGTIHPASALLLRKEVGNASRGGITYELSVSMTHDPVVRCANTGKSFVLPWADIIAQACAAGIDQDDRQSRTNHGAPITL